MRIRIAFLIAVATFIVASSSTDAADDGQAIATAGTPSGAHACSACHGVLGEGRPVAGYPRLSGLGKDYIRRQLENFADGSRSPDPMGPIAKALSPAQRDAVAAYYAALTPSAADPQINRVSERARSLAETGDWSIGLPACSQCHGMSGVGVGTSFPALAGQSPQYLEKQLRAWKAGDRGGDPLNLMTGIASKLDDDEISAIADYYASLKLLTSKGQGQ